MKSMRKATKSERAAKRVAKSRIPEFATIEEEAEFWDTHDSAEFEDEFEELDEPLEVLMYRAAPKRALTVRLEPDLIDMLAGVARTKGVGPSTLARMWIMEQLRAARVRPPRRKRSTGAA
jgi:hypothetical protein